MPSYPYPNWIIPPDLAGEYARGQQLGLEQSRMQMQAEENQRAHLMEQQRLEVDRAFKEQQLAMDKQQLDQATKLNQLKIQDAAQQLDAQKKYQDYVNSLGPTPSSDQLAQGLLKYGMAGGSSLAGYAGILKDINLSRLGPTPESPIGKLQFDRTQALRRGDDNAVKQIDAAIQEAATNKGRSIYMGQDDQGKPIFQMTEGGAKPVTVATQSLAQGKLLQYQNATELMSWLQQHLKPEHLGVQGLVGELAVDRTLAQLVPEFANKERIPVRAALDAAQGLAREIVDSPAGRFSNVERDAVLGAVPSTGLAESYENAVGRLQRAKEMLANRGRTYSEAIGEPLPTWAMSKDQIKQAYQQGKSSGLKPDSPDFKKRGFLTEQQALDALQRYF